MNVASNYLPLELLPDEIIVHIAGYCDNITLISLISKRLHSISVECFSKANQEIVEIIQFMPSLKRAYEQKKAAKTSEIEIFMHLINQNKKLALEVENKLYQTLNRMNLKGIARTNWEYKKRKELAIALEKKIRQNFKILTVNSLVNKVETKKQNFSKFIANFREIQAKKYAHDHHIVIDMDWFEDKGTKYKIVNTDEFSAKYVTKTQFIKYMKEQANCVGKTAYDGIINEGDIDELTVRLVEAMVLVEDNNN